MNENIDEDEKKYCVYMHIAPDDKKYIGITCRDVFSRWGKDGNNYIKQYKFYQAILKYGWDNFEHIIVKEKITSEEASELEKELIKKYNTIKNGFNILAGGLDGFSTIKQKYADIVYVYDINGNYFGKYENIGKAVYKINLNREKIYKNKYKDKGKDNKRRKFLNLEKAEQGEDCGLIFSYIKRDNEKYDYNNEISEDIFFPLEE